MDAGLKKISHPVTLIYCVSDCFLALWDFSRLLSEVFSQAVALLTLCVAHVVTLLSCCPRGNFYCGSRINQPNKSLKWALIKRFG